jgi:hypothetical protein
VPPHGCLRSSLGSITHLIIDGIDLVVRHEDGEERMFRWAGLGETFSEITDSAGNKQIVSKDQTPIAIKVVTQSLLDKFVRFQEPRFHAADGLTTRALVSHFNFLKQKSPDGFVPQVLESKEYFAVVEQRQKWFWWKTSPDGGGKGTFESARQGT